MMKRFLADLFGIDTHEQDLERLTKEKEWLATEMARYKVLCEKMEAELSFYKLEDEEKIKVLMEDANDAYKYYMTQAKKCETMINAMENIIHREFARGRQCAYSELGIWNIDAHKRGNSLAILENGEVVEVICDDLVDVKADVGKMTIPDDEIVIDDLVEIA